MKLNKYLLLMLLLISPFLITGCWVTGRGTAQDTMYQIQYDGLIWKTYDVWLTNDHPTESHSAIYCPEVDNIELVKKIQEAVNSKSKCTIEYHNEFIIAPWRCSSDTIIDNIDCELK